MDFASWCDAVDAALRAQGKLFSTAQVDPSDLQNAFQSGQSPVMFARATTAPNFVSPARLVQPAPPIFLPEPNRKLIRFLFQLFTFTGWLIWAAAACAVLLLGVVIVLTIFPPSSSRSARESTSSGLAEVLAYGVPWVASWTLFLLLAGGVWHTIAQGLMILVRVEENSRTPP